MAFTPWLEGLVALGAFFAYDASEDHRMCKQYVVHWKGAAFSICYDRIMQDTEAISI